MYGLTETQGFEERRKTELFLFLLTNDKFLFIFDIYVQALMTKKSTKQQPTDDIQMASNSDIMLITRVKMKFLSLKENEFGHNHFFNVLGITPLQDLIELRKSLNMSIWVYNDKFYLNL